MPKWSCTVYNRDKSQAHIEGLSEKDLAKYLRQRMTRARSFKCRRM